MSWRGILAPKLVWFLSYKHLKFPNLAGFCSYALTLIDRNSDMLLVVIVTDRPLSAPLSAVVTEPSLTVALFIRGREP